ncbi:MAG TPA: PHP domain-containing protein, partial [Hyphomicrobiaceae bacterium]|nr:PHP domain-containing protein [Hyphomicrobiaceae bacterium]
MTAAADPAFVHVKVHSAYSLLEGAITIAKLAKLAVAQGFPALGLTDSGNLFGALEFSDKLAAAGVQPIVGMTLKVDFGEPDRTGPGRPLAPQARLSSAGVVALIACNERGYQNLMQLSSRAFLDPAENEPPHVKLSQLQGDRAQGLIALTGGPDGPINRALSEEQRELAGERLAALAAIYGDRLYVELQRHGLAQDLKTEPELIALAYARSLPIVASNEVYFASPDDYEAHDALLCIAEGSYVTEDNRRRLSR